MTVQTSVDVSGIRGEETVSGGGALLRWLAVLALIWGLLVAVGLIGSGFKLASAERAQELFALASNPFAGLVIGTVATALIQSSSTVTSIIVALVAGGLPVGIAIPMIMGANIGTTITNTLVSLGHIRSKDEFKRAFAAATVHDFFNLVSVVIFLPLEILFHPLEKMSYAIAEPLLGGGGMSMSGMNFMKMVTKPPINTIKHSMESLEPVTSGVIMAILGICLIFFVITLIR